jgi:hypothetical protein
MASNQVANPAFYATEALRFQTSQIIPPPSKDIYPIVVEVLSKTTSRPSAKTWETLPLRQPRYSFKVSMSLPAMRFEQRNIWTDQGMSSKSLTLFVWFGSLLLWTFEGVEPVERPIPIQDNINPENTHTTMARVGRRLSIPAAKRHRALCMSQSVL